MAGDWKTEFNSREEVAEARKRGRDDFRNCVFKTNGVLLLVGMDLSGCDFREADLRYVALDASNLTQCLFIGARLHGAYLKGVQVEMAYFDPHIVPQLVAAVTLGVRISDPGPDDNRFNRC